MRLGAENKKQIVIMVVLLTILLGVAIYDFAGSGGTSAAPPAASTAAKLAATLRSDGADATPAHPQSEEQGLRLLSRLLVQPHRPWTCGQVVVQRAAVRIAPQVGTAGVENSR